MRRMILLLGVLTMTLLADASLTFGAPSTVTTLPNGLTVLVQEDDRFPLVSLRLYVHAGSSYETPKQAGISHLLEHMVFKGTGKRGPGRVAEDIESVGGYLNAATSFDYTVYMADMPAEHWVLGLDVLQDMTFGMALDETELANEKKVVISELERGEDQPSSLLFKSIQPLVWPDTSYARPIIGYRDTVMNTTSQDIKDYVADLYQPQSMLLVVCGNVKNEEVMKQVDRLFAHRENTKTLHPHEPLDIAPIINNVRGPKINVEYGKWNKAYLSIAFPIPGFHASETAGLEVLAHLLGGDKTSRLYRAFKYNNQLVDDISVSAVTLEGVGMFYVRASLEQNKLEEFWPALIKELSTMKAQDFTKQELTRAKLNLEDSLYRAKETLSGLASKIGFFQFFENDSKAEEDFIFDLRNVDLTQLQQLIDAYVQPNCLTSVMLLPEQKNTQNQAAELEKTVSSLWPAKTTVAAKTKVTTTPKDTQTLDLGNGLQLVLIPDPTLPYTSVNMIFRGGDVLLNEDEQGLAELTSHTLFKGTDSKNATQIQELLADHAAALSATVSRDLFYVNSKFPTRFSKEILGLLEESLRHPAFSQEEVDREKQNQIATIRSREDQPLGLAYRNIFPFLFQNRPYSYYHLGHADGIAKFSRQQVLDYWHKQRKQPWTMAVCGNFDRDLIIATAKRFAELSQANGGPTKAPAYITPSWAPEKFMNLHLAQRNQAHILLLFKTAGRTDKDSAGLQLLRAILTGQSGLLFDLREEKSLGYTVSAFLWQNPALGFMAFYIGTEPERVDEAMDGFKKVVSTLNTTNISQTDIDRGKNQLRGEYYRDHQSLASRSREAASLLIQDMPLNTERDLIDQANKLDAQDLQAIAQKYFKWNEAYVMKVIP